MHTMRELRLIYLHFFCAQDMHIESGSADKDEMLIIKASNGITGEGVATIVQAMLIEAEYDDFEQKLTLQQGQYSTYFLLV